MAIHGIQPPSHFRAERGWQRLLHPGPADNDRRPMLGRKFCQAATQPIQITRDNFQRLPQLQNTACIDRILARRAPMHVPCCIAIALRDQSSKRFDQWNGNIPREFCAASQLRNIEQFRFAFRRDRRRGRGGNYAGSRLRSRQTDLEI